MFDFTVCTAQNKKLFYEQCAAIERHVPGLQKLLHLVDVDSTLIQAYNHRLGQITVTNDTEVDALYVQADFDLLPYFN